MGQVAATLTTHLSRPTVARTSPRRSAWTAWTTSKSRTECSHSTSITTTPSVTRSTAAIRSPKRPTASSTRLRRSWTSASTLTRSRWVLLWSTRTATTSMLPTAWSRLRTSPILRTITATRRTRANSLSLSPCPRSTSKRTGRPARSRSPLPANRRRLRRIPVRSSLILSNSSSSPSSSLTRSRDKTLARPATLMTHRWSSSSNSAALSALRDSSARHRFSLRLTLCPRPIPSTTSSLFSSSSRRKRRRNGLAMQLPRPRPSLRSSPCSIVRVSLPALLTSSRRPNRRGARGSPPPRRSPRASRIRGRTRPSTEARRSTPRSRESMSKNLR